MGNDNRMKVFSLTYCSSEDGERVTEWFRNKTDAQTRRKQIIETFRSLDSHKRDRLEWSLGQPLGVLVPETKDDLVRWLNNHVGS